MVKSIQDILKQRQQEEFVGREEQLAFFEENLQRSLEDPRRRFVISVSGQGGVGKTWLLRQFRRIAEGHGALTAWTDELQDNLPEVMGCLAEQFAAQGHSLREFAERYRVYRQRKQEIETDPEAPRGLPALIGRTLARGSLQLARQVPIGGVVANLVDEELLISWAGDFANYVARKIGNKDEVRLVLEPVEVLTPLFLSGLLEIAKKHPVALFFDTYERTADFLDPWLRDLLEGRYGEVPANILLVIAGQNELNCDQWAPYEGLLARLPLQPFTEPEARTYLARKGITDERIVKVILSLSGRLPLLLATLAVGSPDDPSKVGDRSGEAVERFLKWVEEPRQRQVVLDAALPRRLNRDVLAVLVGEADADALFAWLSHMPFVQPRGDGWAYHEVVRSQMLRHKRRLSPRGWADLHGRLADFWERLRDGLGLAEEAAARDMAWQAYTLEAIYHRLCQHRRALAAALNGFVTAWDASADFARSLAETIRQAGVDGDVALVRDWGERLAWGLDAYQGEDHSQVLAFLSALLDEGGLEDKPRASVLARRGETYRLLGKYEEALADFHRAVELNSDDAWALALRGESYRLMGKYEEALSSLNRAIELQPDYAWALTSRGATYRLMGRYEKALADLNQAIGLNSDYAWALTHRGATYRLMGRYEEALADLNRAVELSPDYVRALAHRGATYRLMGRYEDALADFNRAIALKPDEDWYQYERALTYRAMGREEEAQDDLAAAIRRAREAYAENPCAWSNVLNLALYHLAAGETERAEQLYEEAIAGAPPPLLREALQDLDDLLVLFPDHRPALVRRERLQAHLEEARR